MALDTFVALARDDAIAAFEARDFWEERRSTWAEVGFSVGRAKVVRRGDLLDGMVFDSVGIAVDTTIPTGIVDVPSRVHEGMRWWYTYDLHIDAKFPRSLGARRQRVRRWTSAELSSAIEVSTTRARWLLNEIGTP